MPNSNITGGIYILNTQLMFSTGNNNVSTPQQFFDRLDQVFNFTLDPCADDFNYKCELYYTKEMNGLERTWGGADGIL